jgi:hypothetical protein
MERNYTGNIYIFIRLFFLNDNELYRCALLAYATCFRSHGNSSSALKEESLSSSTHLLERGPLPWAWSYINRRGEDAAVRHREDIVPIRFLLYFPSTPWGNGPKQMIRAMFTEVLVNFSGFLPFFGKRGTPTAFYRTEISRQVLHRILWVFLDNSLHIALDAWPCMMKY